MSQDPQNLPEALPRTTAVLREGIEAGLHPGAQVYVSLDGAAAADFALGAARPGVRMTRQTITLWMSAIKPIMSVAIARLWEAGKLTLDDPIALHVPEFAQGGKERITIRHALTHTGGFNLLRTGDDYETVLGRIYEMRLQPRWVPGRTAGYHVHSAWYILAELVYRLTGTRYGQFAREQILEPLAMNDTWIGMPAEAFWAYGDRIATVHNTSTGESAPESAPQVFSTMEDAADPRPSGNGRGPIRELGRFYEMLLQGGTLNGVRILSPQSVEALVARHRAGIMDNTFKHIIDWGLGFIIDSKQYDQDTLPYGYGPHASPRTFGHSGYECSCAFADPEHRLVVAWVCNGMPGDAKHQQRQRAINQAIYEDLSLAG